MKDPYPINLMTRDEVRKLGWAGEARDQDGHLISTTALDQHDTDINRWILEMTERGCTVTFFDRS